MRSEIADRRLLITIQTNSDDDYDEKKRTQLTPSARTLSQSTKLGGRRSIISSTRVYDTHTTPSFLPDASVNYFKLY